MNRLIRIVSGFIVAGAASLGVSAALIGSVPSASEDRSAAIATVDRVVAHLQSHRGRVLWIGDSTLQAEPPTSPWSYAMELLVDPSSASYDGQVLALPGLTSFEYYYMISHLLEARPSLVVIVANFRLLHSKGVDSARDYLCRFLNWDDLIGSLGLPFHARGMTVPALLACPAMDSRLAEAVHRRVELLRSAVRQSSFWGAETPVRQPRDLYANLEDQRRYLERYYDGTISPRGPYPRMLSAVVQRVRKAGAEALVVITPVPVHRLVVDGVASLDELQQKADAIRQVTEMAGGRVLDLYAALDEDGFRDVSGHFSAIGNDRMRDLVGREIEGILRPANPHESERR